MRTRSVILSAVLISLVVVGWIAPTSTISGTPTITRIPGEADREASLVGAALVIKAGLLIDGTGTAPRSQMLLVVADGRLQTIGKAGDIAVPKGATVLDASAYTVMPGLIDMHVHYYPWMDELFLSHGVTTVRDVGSHLETILGHRHSSRSPGVFMPRIFACGPLIDGLQPRHGTRISRAVATAAEARTVARALLEHNVDCLKTYEKLTPPQIKAIVRVASSRGIPVTAHLRRTRATEAIALGVTGLEHASGIDYMRATPAELHALADQIADARVFVVPTVALTEHGSLVLSPDILREPLLKEVPWRLMDWWAKRRNSWTEARAERSRVRLARKQMLIAALAKNNGRIVAGSDTPNLYVLPGAGLLRELELLVEAGLRPMQALQAATKVAAAFLGQGSQLGTLEVGKRADLVILRGNPIEDISKIRNVETVLRDGRVVWGPWRR